MNLKERINDIFTKYSVSLEATEQVDQEVKAEKEEETKEDVALAEKTLANGTIIYTDAEDFAVGAEVFIVNEEGERMPLPDGEYDYEGGGKTIVADGLIAEIQEGEVEEEEVVAEDEEAEEVEAGGDKKKKKKMSEDVFTQSQVQDIVAEAVAKVREEFALEQAKHEAELAEVKQEFGKIAATGGLPKTKTETKRLSRTDINRLSAQERVAALYEFYS